MGIILVLGVSILLQLGAALLALRLIAVTGRRRAWVLIAAAVSLMAVRRSITLFRLLSGDVTQPPDMAAELVALAISVLMVTHESDMAAYAGRVMRFVDGRAEAGSTEARGAQAL